MDCSQCQRTIPQESLFCLYCGARLPDTERAVPVNGGGAAPPGGGRAAGRAPGAPPRETRKRPYALSFRLLGDERVRYRVARWVCDVAPAHAVDEVQQDLLRGEFRTFLALTSAEADVAREQVAALGVHPALVNLVPATEAELVFPMRALSPGKRGKATWSTGQKLAALGVAGAGLLALGWALLSLFGTR